jgi:hypothetical protein
MEASINFYLIGAIISFIILLSMFEAQPEDLSKMFGLTEKFNFYWIFIFTFMMSVFWIIALPMFIICKTKK